MKKSIKGQAIITMLLTVVQKALAFVRSAILAALFGASGQTDAFYMASGIIALFANIPNTLSTAIIPVRTKEMSEGGEKRADDYTNSILNLALMFSAVMAGIAVVFSPQLLDVFAPRFPAETRKITIIMLRVLVPTFILSTVMSVVAAVLNYHKRFFATALGGVSLSVVWLIIPLMLWRRIGIYAMAAGYLAGVTAQVLTLCFLLRGRFRYSAFCWNYKSPAVKMTFAMCLPMFVSSSANMISQTVEKALASGLPDGSLSALSYAQQLNLLLFSVISDTLAIVIFTTLSQLVQEGKTKEIIALAMRAVSVLILIMLPATIYCAVFADAVVRIAFGRGAFDSAAITLTGNAIIYYSLGFVPYGIAHILCKLFHAFMDTKTPMYTFMVFIAFNVGLSLMLVGDMGIGGLALSASISYAVYALLLVIFIRRKLGPMGFLKFAVSSSKILLAAAALIAVCYVFKAHVVMPIIPKAIAALTLSGATYLLILVALRHEEMMEMIGYGIKLAKQLRQH